MFKQGANKLRLLKMSLAILEALGRYCTRSKDFPMGIHSL